MEKNEMHATAREILLYLYFEQCGKSNKRLFETIRSKEEPKCGRGAIHGIVEAHPEWQDAITVIDADYPEFLKRSSACADYIVLERKDVEKARREADERYAV